MYSLFIASVLSISLFFINWRLLDVRWGWAILWSFLLFFLVMVLINFLVKQKVALVMSAIQKIFDDGQIDLNKRLNAFNARPSQDSKRFLSEVDKQNKRLIAQALEQTILLEPYTKWTPLFARQINATKMQFYYQMQNFKMVDELLPKCLIIEQLSAAMKMARQYVNKAPLADIEKTFSNAKNHLRYNQSTLIYSLLAWIYVKNNMMDKAHALLVKACKDNEHDTLNKNLERLANNRGRDFSNAGLGDQWFMLFLEKPKVHNRRIQPRADGRPF